MYNELRNLEQCDTNFICDIKCFANPHIDRDYTIVFHDPKFRSKCPVTEMYDYAEVKVTYHPYERCMELISLRKYLRSFHDRFISHEATAHKILNDIMDSCDPRILKVEIVWEVVDGTRTSILVTDINWRKPQKNGESTSKD